MWAAGAPISLSSSGRVTRVRAYRGWNHGEDPCSATATTGVCGKEGIRRVQCACVIIPLSEYKQREGELSAVVSGRGGWW